MTAKFDAFKAALEALCIEHGVRLDGGDECDDGVGLMLATDEAPAGLHFYIGDDIPETPEEIAARQERYKYLMADSVKNAAAMREAEARRLANLNADEDYQHMVRLALADAEEQRTKQMRVSIDPTDPAYVDARARRVKVNDREIADWQVADEFRRVVILKDGTVINGSVWIERLPDVEYKLVDPIVSDKVTPITRPVQAKAKKRR